MMAMGTSAPSRATGTTLRNFAPAVLLLATFMAYALTMATSISHTDVFGANWTSWHIAHAGTPWIDGTPIPEVAGKSDALLSIRDTADGHTAFGRFPGIVAVALPAYFAFGRDTFSVVPGSLTAALLTACSVSLFFSALRRYLPQKEALVAALAFGFTTPMWSISANLLWPHTVTVLGITGMAWAASRDKWWSTGVFGGIALLGRLHAAVIVAVLGAGLAAWKRDHRILVKTGVPSLLCLLASCGWDRWVYGSWSPLAGYVGASSVAGSAKSYAFSIENQLGMWVSPDRGILVWTPIILVLLPGLVRSWRTLPDWSRMLLVGGLLYTCLQSELMVFDGGDGFYGYRYGLEALACAAPALALAYRRTGRAGRIFAAPLLALQFLAFLMGSMFDNLYILKSDVWRANAFAHALNRIGPSGWVFAVVVAVAALVIAARADGRRHSPTNAPPERAKASA
jgi:hypothetical protein